MNFWLNEYFKFSFELNIEFNNLCAWFNVWLNNRNVSDRASWSARLHRQQHFAQSSWKDFKIWGKYCENTFLTHGGVGGG